MNEFNEEIKKKIDLDISKNIVSSRAILDRFCVIDEVSRKTCAYLDPKYLGFYYHLGKYIKPKSVMEIGFTLGLPSSCFFLSCKSARHFLGYKEVSQDFIPVRLGKRNIRLVFKNEANFHIGKLYDPEFDNIFSPNSWDLIILNDETVYDKHLEYLDFVWSHVSEHGLVVAEYIDRHTPAKEAFFAFCESKNRKPVVFETRYGTGILQK